MTEPYEEETTPGSLTKAPRHAWYLVVALTMLNVLGMGIIFPVLPFLTLRYVSPTSLAAIQMVGPLPAGWMYAVAGHSIPYWTGLVMILAAALVFVRSGRGAPLCRRRSGQRTTTNIRNPTSTSLMSVTTTATTTPT